MYSFRHRCGITKVQVQLRFGITMFDSFKFCRAMSHGIEASVAQKLIFQKAKKTNETDKKTRKMGRPETSNNTSAIVATIIKSAMLR